MGDVVTFRCFRCGWSTPAGAPTAHQCRNPHAPWVRVGMALQAIEDELREDEAADAATFDAMASWAAAAVDRWTRTARAIEARAAVANHPSLWETKP